MRLPTQSLQPVTPTTPTPPTSPPEQPVAPPAATPTITHAPLSFAQKLTHGEFLLLTGRELTQLALLAMLVLAAVLWVLFRFIEPPPPKVVRISTGSPTGAYTRYAKQYAEALKTHGITLEVVTSAGSVENLKRLDDPAQKFDLAFVQGGVGSAEQHPALESLASVAYEPIWVFFSKKSFKSGPPTRLTELKGRAIGIDAEGSGVRVAATELLKMNQISAQEARLSALGGMAAVDAVLAGTLEAAILVASVDSPAVQKALAEDLGLMNFENADAYARLLPWVAKVTLPKGVAHLARNLPTEDVTLIAATANLVARGDLHRAVMFLVLDVASSVHKKPAAVNAMTEFPSERNLDYTQSEESKRFFKTGRPFLQQYLPFWLANLIERMLVTIVPILAIGIPLLRLIPAFLEWRERSELTRLYDEVLALEHRHYDTPQDKSNSLARLTQIDQLLPSLKLGASHHVDVYNLKSHMELVKARLSAA